MFSVRFLYVLLFAVSTFRVVSSFLRYQQLIPNGQQVPNPCEDGKIWRGVGHWNPAGADFLNPFGRDFANSDHNWTVVCHLDSDGDGRTNGDELGDPDCRWKPGVAPPRLNGLSHPGICEPLNSRSCLTTNSWLKCPKQSSCSVVNQPGVLKKTFRFPPTPVPPVKDTHMCLGIQLPDDIVVNQKLPVAVVPHLDNKVVMHHVNLWGCASVPSDASYETPMQCRQSSECERQHRVRLWTIGQEVRCTPATKLGFNGSTIAFEYAVLELHWRNAMLSSDRVDSSGITLYYTDSDDTSSKAADIKSTTSALLILIASLRIFARIAIN